MMALSGTSAAAQREHKGPSAAPTRSALFSVYNVARGMVADSGRLNRALGVAMRTRTRRVNYITTAERCTCPDQTYRPWTTCKHRLALALKAAASEAVV